MRAGWHTAWAALADARERPINNRPQDAILPHKSRVWYDSKSSLMLRFETAGESHGECLVATLTGLPAGIPISVEAVNRELWRRQQGYGRGGRMKIETDRAEIVAGVRHSHTIGSPVAIVIRNRDWQNWTEALPVEDIAGADDKRKPVTRPRPGHADLAGAIKYDFHDARYILERASARETAARVAVGALAKALLGEFGIRVLSHVIGGGAGEAGTRGGVGRTGRLEPARRSPAGLRGPGGGSPHERSGGRGLPHRRYRGRRFRSGGARRPRGPGLAHRLGYAAGRAPGAGHRFHAGGEGRGSGIRGGRRGQLRLESAGHHPLRSRRAALHARRQPRRGTRRRHHQRAGRAGARLSQAHFHAAAAARIGGPGDARARAGRLRALGRVRGAGRRRDWRGHGGAGAGAGVPGKVRRRFARRDAAQLRWLSANR